MARRRKCGFGVCMGKGRRWEETLRRRIGNRFISSLPARSIFTAAAWSRPSSSSLQTQLQPCSWSPKVPCCLPLLHRGRMSSLSEKLLSVFSLRFFDYSPISNKYFKNFNKIHLTLELCMFELHRSTLSPLINSIWGEILEICNILKNSQTVQPRNTEKGVSLMHTI